jgi:hypothetical protein
MLLQFCDKCGRPLSEGCLARGEAVERKGELICSACVAREQTSAAVQAAAQQDPGPLGQYQQAVWSCESCGIPVTALDLIEGRASRMGGVLKCSRCASVTQTARPAPDATAPAPPTPAPARPLPPRAAPSLPRRAPLAPRHSHAAAESYVAEATTEQKRPILPIVMFAIILPMFAVSLYFAVSSQIKLNEVMSGKDDEGAPDRRNRRPQETLRPEPADENTLPPANQPIEQVPQPGPSQPASVPGAGPEPMPLPPEVINDLVAIEQQLAAPVINQLQSQDLAEVWQGLITAGSRRLIACRPHVRALLREPDDQTRAMACRVAAMLEDREALPRLKGMQEQDPSEVVRTEARKAADRLTGQATREIGDLTDAELEKMLRDLQRELERRKGRSD